MESNEKKNAECEKTTNEGIAIEEVRAVLQGIYNAAAGITGEQKNHVIALAIMNDANKLNEKIVQAQKEAKKE